MDALLGERPDALDASGLSVRRFDAALATGYFAILRWVAPRDWQGIAMRLDATANLGGRPLRSSCRASPSEDIADFAAAFVASLSADKAFDAVGHTIEKTGLSLIRPIANTEQFDSFAQRAHRPGSTAQSVGVRERLCSRCIAPKVGSSIM